ncbi:Sec34-like family-domain-containing protein [Glomus cerebriforme]|uniref:Conserved oligomeric Golgi complex subunit 3 n=1 Tax=Glomus cerebriforme TaxID=658196 RepID=A0A397S2K1_9GLOM|nr:Sec34-like family-domain-containing protein [Glomus cerebriforme]
MATTTSRYRGITLEEWEAKTQLTETQRQSVLELQDACAELPLPEGVLSDLGPGTPQRTTSPTPSLVKDNLRQTPYSRLSTSPLPIPKSRSTTNLLAAEFQAAEAAAASTPDASLGIPQPIETTQQFFDWFARMEADMEKDQEDVYRNFLAVVTMYREACHKFLEQIDTTVKLFNDLDSNFKFVEERTKALQTACEKLLDEQNNLTSLADAISAKLSYYNELESITKLFNSPGENICEQEEFISILAKLDECLEYMQTNLRYRDSELYLMRFRQCMTRGMTLIKMYFISTIKGLGLEIAKKNNQILNSTVQSALFYVKFKTIAPKLKELVNEIEKRYPAHREYYSLLNDCYNAYFSVRQQLLIPVIYMKIQELEPTGQDILSFARNGYAYMLNLCSDEYSLFYNFFSTGEDDLYGNLDLLCSYMYDYLRPRIIHETNVETLSELCAILQVHLNQDSEKNGEKEGQGLQFSHLIRNVLEDTQQRLVFRVQTFIRNEIQNFVPQASDLDYPNRLKGSINERIESGESNLASLDNYLAESSSSSSPAILAVQQDNGYSEDNESMISPTNVIDTGNMYRGWFPTLQRTLWILSKLYQCVNTTIFDDIAQDVVDLCLQSLLTASELIIKEHKLDGQLFLIKHLLILKDQIASFDTQFVHEEKDLDFSEITTALSEILQNKYSILSPNTLLGLAQKGIPKIVENRVDSKQEVDKELKRICEEFITESVQAAIEPLSSFILKVSAFKIRSNLKPIHQQTLLKNQNFAEPAKIVEVFETFQNSVKIRLQYIIKKMLDYLEDRKTVNILLKPMQYQIIDTYQTFYDTLQQEGYEFDKFPKSIRTVEEIKEWVKSEWFWKVIEEINE